MADTHSKTPWHLWVVGVFLLLWQGVGTFDFVATIARFEPYLSGFPEEVLEHYFNAPLWMYVMWGVATIGGLIGAILLLARNKLAVPAFGLAWLASVASMFWSLANPAPEGAGGATMMIIVIVAALMVLFYIFRMQRRGVLR